MRPCRNKSYKQGCYFLHRATLILEIYLRWSRDKYNINNRCIMLEVKIVRKNFTILTI